MRNMPKTSALRLAAIAIAFALSFALTARWVEAQTNQDIDRDVGADEVDSDPNEILEDNPTDGNTEDELDDIPGFDAEPDPSDEADGSGGTDDPDGLGETDEADDLDNVNDTDFEPIDDEDDEDERSTFVILEELFYSTGGDEWLVSTGWNFDGDEAVFDPCEWHGIVCYDKEDEDEALRGEIAEIDLSNNEMVGVVPTEVWKLPYLLSFDVRGNVDLDIELSGIGEADFLERLLLSNTNLSTLEGIENALQLLILHISNTEIDGNTLPEEVFELSSLLELVANNCKFQGKLSPLIGNLVDLRELYLHDNDFTGQLPAELGSLEDLQILYLSQNDFSGSIPPAWNNLESLETIDIHREFGEEKSDTAGLTGELISFSRSPNLKNVFLQDNNIGGAIPEDFLATAPATQTVTIDLRKNDLEGVVPASLKRLQYVNMYITDNFFTGLPFFLCEQESWMHGLVDNYLCDAIMCKPGSYSPEGRQTSFENKCIQCEVNAETLPFWGQTKPCDDLVEGDTVTQYDILMVFYNAMNGEAWWDHRDWGSEEVDECEWRGIECNELGEVIGIFLDDNNLAGTFPPVVFQLPKLETIDINHNAIDFRFSGIAEAQSLKNLYLDGLGLTTLVDVDELQGIELEELILNRNAISGPIPAVLYDLPKLNYLGLSHNEFSGPIATEIGTLANLEVFECYGNQINGTLPTELGKLTKLIGLVISENRLTGTLPTELNQLVNLEELSLHQVNKPQDHPGISGPLLSFAETPRLTVINVASNSIDGPLPEDFLAGSQLLDQEIAVDLFDNALSGVVPASWSRFDRIYINLAENKLTSIDPTLCEKEGWMSGLVGTLNCDAIMCPVGTYSVYGRATEADSCLPCTKPEVSQTMGSAACDVTEELVERILLEELFYATDGFNWRVSTGWLVSANVCEDWFGISCNTDGHVEKIDLRKNNLAGDPPAGIWRLKHLKELILYDNYMDISFEGITDAESLEVLDLSRTGLKSLDGLPGTLKLRELHLTQNHLQGSIPEQIFELFNLERLYMAHNRFSGKLIQNFSFLGNLKEVSFMNNQLTGQITAALGSLLSLEILQLSFNKFTGTLPNELNELENLKFFALESFPSEPGLNGPLIPFTEAKNLTDVYLAFNALQGQIPEDFMENTNPDQEIDVDLRGNELVGAIPSSFARFSKLEIGLADNQITEINPEFCSKEMWMDGLVGEFSCDAVLCPPQTYSDIGRQQDESTQCIRCPDGERNEFYGSTSCKTAEGDLKIVERDILELFFVEMGGPNWKLRTHWQNPDKDICLWHGITCTGSTSGTVKAIELPDNALIGDVPSDIFLLPDLEVVNLGGNLDISLVVDDIGNANALKVLNLDFLGLDSLEGLERAQQLTYLSARWNNFESFPEQIFALSNLKGLNLENARFGPLPEGLSRMTALEDFACEDCGFSGNVPTWIGSMSSLVNLDLSNGDLTGVLPEEITELKRLRVFDVSNQNGPFGDGLSGRLLDFDGMPDITEIRLAGNSIQGDIPDNFLGMADVEGRIFIDLEANLLAGSVPTELARFDNLVMYLAGNEIDELDASLCEKDQWNDGAVGQFGCDGLLCPKGTSSLVGRATQDNDCEACENGSDAVYFGSLVCSSDNDELDESDLTPGSGNPEDTDSGETGNDEDTDASDSDGSDIENSDTGNTEDTDAGDLGDTGGSDAGSNEPTNGGSGSEMTEIEILTAFYNELNGNVWNSDQGWTSSDVDICSWFGIECYEEGEMAGSVARVILDDNNLDGIVPASIFKLPGLKELRLPYNQIQVSFEALQDAKNLEILYLSETGMESIEGIGKAPALKVIHATGNQLKEIPDELFDVDTLEQIFMNHNAIVGNLSPKISQLSKLKTLFLFDNLMTGSIPSEIGQLSELETLVLGENFMTGQLPGELNGLSKLKILSLQGQGDIDEIEVGGALAPKDASALGRGLTGKLLAFDQLKDLAELYLGWNSFSGFIPSTFLGGVANTTVALVVDLAMNELEGNIPPILERFEEMDLFLAGNEIDHIPAPLCEKSLWMDERVAVDGCDAILCPVNTYNSYGRMNGPDLPCKPCPPGFASEFFGSVACSPDGSTVPESDGHDVRHALMKFYMATGGEGWTKNANWMDDDVDVCSWEGVRCEGEGVVEIKLDSNGLMGMVPPDIYSISTLKILDIRDNAVDMDWTDIGTAVSLEELFLDATSIDSFEGLEAATQLRVLSLQENSFEGRTLPDEIFALTSLEYLYLSDTGFEGVISPKVGDLVNLLEFYCRRNELTGSIPTEFGLLENLEVLGLSNNKLTGSIPVEVAELPSLRELFLDNFDRDEPGLTGTLPSFDKVPGLREVYLGSNSLSGTIPETFLGGLTDTTAKVTVEIAMNQLEGVVPRQLSRLDKLNIDLGGNKFTGIDETLCKQEMWMNGLVGDYGCDALLCKAGTFARFGRQESEDSGCEPCDVQDPNPYLGALTCEGGDSKETERQILEKFYNNCGGENWKNSNNWLDDDFDICHWYGVSCAGGTSVESILLGSNNLIGTPPEDIFELENLKTLWLYSNPIKFSFNGIGKATKLTSLLLDSTGLESLEGVGEAKSLVDLDVRFNQLRGPLPREILELGDLEILSASENQISGNLPDFETMVKLMTLRLSSNLFTGTLPTFEAQIDMTTIDLSGNRIGGTIPKDFLANVNAREPVSVDLSDNFLTGFVPAELSRFEDLTLLLRDNFISGVEGELCRMQKWNDGDVGSYDCAGLLCPPGTYGPDSGRATAGSGCLKCESNRHFGTSECAGKSADSPDAPRNNPASASSGHRNFAPSLATLFATVAGATLLLISMKL